MNREQIEALRNDYSDKGIDTDSLPDRPFSLFAEWFEQAVSSGIAEPNAMVIATVGSLSEVEIGLSQRTVLMKSFDDQGFYFYTNYGSRKASSLKANPQISCLFPWLALHRQVAVEGRVSKADRDTSARYFASRPRGSQIGAWASYQSQPMDKRQDIEQRVAELEEKYDGKDVPLPPFWGGFHVAPTRFEFWQGRHSRLHDRIVFERASPRDTNWVVTRLNP